LVIYSNAL